MRKVLFIFYMIILFSLSTYCIASDSTTGKVNRIGGQLTGEKSIYFGLDVEPDNRPPCSNHTAYHYVFDPGTDEGKALYSALLYARAQGASIRVKGTGECILNQPMESVSFWLLPE